MQVNTKINSRFANLETTWNHWFWQLKQINTVIRTLPIINSIFLYRMMKSLLFYTILTYPVKQIFRGTGLVFHLLLGTFHKSCLTFTCPVNLRFWKLLHHHRSLNIEQQIREQNESKCRKRFFTTLIEGNFRISGLQIVSEMKFILR